MESKGIAAILVVDDQVDIRILAKRILEAEGHSITVAKDGHEALDILSKQHIDVIIADIAMPNMNGYQLFEHVSQHPEYSNIPYILLSARDLDSDIRYGKSLGVDDYITKPFNPADLVASVRGRLTRIQQLTDCMDSAHLNLMSHNTKNLTHETTNNKEESSISIDTQRQLVERDGSEIKLSAREFRLLHLLHANQNRVVPIQELIGATHGSNISSQQASNLIRPLVRSIRRKLGYQAGESSCIRNVRGIGYQYIEYRDVSRDAMANTEFPQRYMR